MCRGNEEAGLFAREAAYTILQHMYGAVPPATIKDRVLASIGGNKVTTSNGNRGAIQKDVVVVHVSVVSGANGWLQVTSCCGLPLYRGS